jgi:hypothetical protein
MGGPGRAVSGGAPWVFSDTPEHTPARLPIATGRPFEGSGGRPMEQEAYRAACAAAALSANRLLLPAERIGPEPDEVRRVASLSDGAERAISMFRLYPRGRLSWRHCRPVAWPRALARCALLRRPTLTVGATRVPMRATTLRCCWPTSASLLQRLAGSSPSNARRGPRRRLRTMRGRVGRGLARRHECAPPTAAARRALSRCNIALQCPHDLAWRGGAPIAWARDGCMSCGGHRGSPGTWGRHPGSG